MDYSLITASVASLNIAKDLANAAIGLRDFNKLAGAVSQLNDQILKVQQSLLVHNTQLLVLQQQLMDSEKKCREMQKAHSERGRYALVAVSKGAFAYRLKSGIEVESEGGPAREEPDHHLCQRCFDSGTKVVLQRGVAYGSVMLDCSVCKASIPTGEREPYRLD